MATTVHFVPYAKKAAITVPAGAVYEEDEHQYVDVKKDGKREQRKVAAGRSYAGQTEITEGLAVGDEIFTAPAGSQQPSALKGGEE